MLLEAALDDRQHFLVDEPGDRILHQPLLFGERGAHPVEIQRIEARAPGGGLDGFGGFGHGGHSSMQARARIV